MYGEYEKELINVLHEIKDQLRRSNEHRVTITDCLEEINSSLETIHDVLSEIKHTIKVKP